MTVSLYVTVWFITLALNMKHEDCVTIGIDIAMKNMYFATHIIYMIRQHPGDFAELFPGAVVFTTMLMLVTHLLWNTFK